MDNQSDKFQNKLLTLVLADDHPVARAGIRSLLAEAPDIQIVGEAQDGFQAKELVATLKPRILLLDLKMPGPKPAEIEKWVRKNYPDTVTLVLTAHDRDAHLAAMIDAGASAYLNKSESAHKLIKAIRMAAEGSILFDNVQLTRAKRWRRDVEKKRSRLSKREISVLGLLAKGIDNKVIADKLFVTPKTIEKHLTSIYQKLGVTSRSEAIIWWVEQDKDL